MFHSRRARHTPAAKFERMRVPNSQCETSGWNCSPYVIAPSCIAASCIAAGWPFSETASVVMPAGRSMTSLWLIHDTNPSSTPSNSGLRSRM